MKTDIDLQQDVLAELKWEPAIHAAEIGVSVKDGVVTLSGEVGSFPEKWVAQSAAQRVVGVQALVVALDVKLTELGRRTDADIARSAETALDWHASLQAQSLKVMVEHGWITLSGEVEWQFQRQAAMDAVRHLTGVLGVNNQMTIKAKDISSTIQSDIEAALRRVVKTDARDISVAVHGADVTLTGTVNGWSARDLVTRCAWGAEGVRDVVDLMTLSYK
ncbi:BON domain-containing protein [soil metagenome]